MKASIRGLFGAILVMALVSTGPAWAQDDPAEPIDPVEVEEAAEAAEVIEEAEPPVEPMIEELLDVDEEAVEEVEPEARPEPVEAVPDPEPEMPETQAPGAPATFVLQGHPVFSPDLAEDVYRPLVDYLNAVTPYRFDLQIARDYHRYWLDMRRGAMPDLVLEEAHMTAYRMMRDGYEPLVRAAEPMTYSLLASPTYVDGTLDDFVAQPVSSMPAPSLGYLVLSSWFDNPMQQPVILSNAASWLDAIEIVFAMEAEAAMAPRNLVERYVNLEVIETSPEFPGLTLSASPNVPSEIREEIRQALLVLHEDPDHFAAVHELDIERFETATAQEYDGLENWLAEVVAFF